jgi:hypothetical protein
VAEARHLSGDGDGIRKRGKDERQCSYTESRRREVGVVDEVVMRMVMGHSTVQ